MPESQVFRSYEEKGTLYEMYKNPEGHFIRGSGRLNFERRIQFYDLTLLASNSFMQVARYIMHGHFVLREGGEEYTFNPAQTGWVITHNGESFEIQSDKQILEILFGGLDVNSVLKDQTGEIISDDSKKAMTALSAMLRTESFDREEFERIGRYAEEAGDVRVRDMLKIVQRHFRAQENGKPCVDIEIID